MTEPTRLGAREVHERVKAGRAILVCGYEDDAKCRQYRLEGSIPYSDFAKKLPSLPEDQDVIFYCA